MATQTEQRIVPRGRAHSVTPHTVTVRRQQSLAMGVIWGAAIFTMATLVLIVGYIIWNGFYYRDVADYPVTPFTEEVVAIEPGVELSIVVPRDMRLRTLTYPTLREIFSGELPFLGFLTGQNRQAEPIIYGGAGFAEAAERFLLPDGVTFEDLFADVTILASAEEIESVLRDESGTVALVPPTIAEQIGRSKVIGLRQASVIVHPDVTALQAGRRLTTLEQEQVFSLLSGEAAAWSDVGGPRVEIEPADLRVNDPGVYDPLPPVPVVARDPAALWAYAAEATPDDLAFADTTVRVNSFDELVETVRTTPGAVGLVRAREAIDADLPIVPVEHVEHWLNLRPALLVEAPSRAGAVGGLSTIIINTLVLVLFVLIIAAPIGIGAGVYLVEYAKPGILLNMLRLGTDTLTGIPSIIFGLFGLVFFSQILGFQTGLISGTLTLTIMILPTIIRTTEEALKAVPDSLRDGSLALGATKLQTIIRVVLPAASPGILTGIILGIGRVVGETAAILYTLGSNLALIRSLNSPIRVLTIHLYMLIRENISLPNAFAAATILVVIVFLVNYTTTKLIGRLNRAAGQ